MHEKSLLSGYLNPHDPGRSLTEFWLPQNPKQARKLEAERTLIYPSFGMEQNIRDRSEAPRTTSLHSLGHSPD